MKYALRLVLIGAIMLTLFYPYKGDEFEEVSHINKTTHIHIDSLSRSIATVDVTSILFLVNHNAPQRAGY